MIREEAIDRVTGLRDCDGIAASHGNYDYTEYHWGLANGLRLALAIMDDKEPVYLDKPKRWIYRRWWQRKPRPVLAEPVADGAE